jgi:hypothetical protein
MPLKLLQQAVCSSAVQIGAVMARLVCGCMASDWLGCERMERRTSARVAVTLLRFGWQDVYVQSVRHTMHGPCYQVDLIMEKASLTGATASTFLQTHSHAPALLPSLCAFFFRLAQHRLMARPF